MDNITIMSVQPHECPLNCFRIQKLSTLISSGCCDALRHPQPSSLHPSRHPSEDQLNSFGCVCSAVTFTPLGTSPLQGWLFRQSVHGAAVVGPRGFPERKYKKFCDNKSTNPHWSDFRLFKPISVLLCRTFICRLSHSRYKGWKPHTVECDSCNLSQKYLKLFVTWVLS